MTTRDQLDHLAMRATHEENLMKMIICRVMMVALFLAQLCRAAGPLDNWSRQGDGTFAYYNGVAYGGGRFVVVGALTNGTGVIVTSSDGTNWTHAAAGTTNSLNDVSYGNGQFAAVGANGTVVVSPNGTDWTPRDSGMSNLLTSVAYGNGQFVAVGFSFNGLASADGTNWTRIHLGATLSPSTISFAGEQFVLLDYGTILTSTSGSNWSHHFSASPGTSYSGISYGNGRYVAVGSHGQVGGNGNVAVSRDTLTWTPLDIGQSNSLYAVAFGSGLFVAVGGLNGGIG